MLGVIIWWIVDAHKWFKGPKASLSTFDLRRYTLMFIAQVNIEHQMFGRDENMIEGRVDDVEGSEGSNSGSVRKGKDYIKDGNLDTA